MPAWRAARITLAPLTGVTNIIPLPGVSGVRRASTISKLAPALARLSSLSATPPARSSMSTAQTSAFVAVSAIASPSSVASSLVGSITTNTGDGVRGDLILRSRDPAPSAHRFSLSLTAFPRQTQGSECHSRVGIGARARSPREFRPGDDEAALVLGRHHPLHRQVLRRQVPCRAPEHEDGEELHHYGGKVVASALVLDERSRALRHEGIRGALPLVALGREAIGVKRLRRAEDWIE